MFCAGVHEPLGEAFRLPRSSVSCVSRRSQIHSSCDGQGGRLPGTAQRARLDVTVREKGVGRLSRATSHTGQRLGCRRGAGTSHAAGCQDEGAECWTAGFGFVRTMAHCPDARCRSRYRTGATSKRNDRPSLAIIGCGPRSRVSLLPNVACLDYSVAKGEMLVAYRCFVQVKSH